MRMISMLLDKEMPAPWIRNVILLLVTAAAGYLILCGICVINLHEYSGSWVPVQVCMFITGGWISLFLKANESEWDCEEYEEEE